MICPEICKTIMGKMLSMMWGSWQIFRYCHESTFQPVTDMFVVSIEEPIVDRTSKKGTSYF